MNLFRLVLCLAGVALYFVLRGTGSDPAEHRKTAPKPVAQSIQEERRVEASAPQLTPHQEILPLSNALAARPPEKAVPPVPAH